MLRAADQVGTFCSHEKLGTQASYGGRRQRRGWLTARVGIAAIGLSRLSGFRGEELTFCWYRELRKKYDSLKVASEAGHKYFCNR